MLEDYLWELKVSCKRHWMSGHPGIVCVCVCERERERKRENHIVCHVTILVTLAACVITSVVYFCDLIV